MRRHVDKDHAENCPFCKLKTANVQRAAVQFVDEEGETLEVDARELFGAETGEGCGLDPFWGWTLLAYFLPYEESSALDITAVGGD